ncbi:MAG: lipase family protein [Planktothrix sp.]
MFDLKIAQLACTFLTALQNKRLDNRSVLITQKNVFGIEYALFRSDYGNILCFSGVNEMSDLQYLYDFRYRKRSEGGVLSGLRSAFSMIAADLSNINCEIICGYSMGGVLATFFSFYSKWVIPTYLFGSPRPGDQNFADSYNDKLLSVTYRISTVGDPIGHVPVTGWHIGNPIILSETKILDRQSEWANLVAQNFFDDPKFALINPLLLFLAWKRQGRYHDLNYYNLLLKGLLDRDEDQ